LKYMYFWCQYSERSLLFRAFQKPSMSPISNVYFFSIFHSKYIYICIIYINICILYMYILMYIICVSICINAYMPFPPSGDIWSHLIVTMIFNFSFPEKNILIKAGYKYQNYHEKQSHPS
jgi:hypothetical protein